MKCVKTDGKIGGIPEAKNLARAKRGLAWLLGLGLTLWALSSEGEGFRNPPAGTFNLGRSGGRIAQIDDASAAVQNPANLVDLSKVELELSPSIIYIGAEFDAANGQHAETTDPWKLLPNFFAAVPLADGRFAAGLGVTVPYGLGNKWDENTSAFARPGGTWRYQAPTSAELTTVDVMPAFSAKIGESLQVGLALEVMWSQLTLKQYYPWFLVTGSLSSPDGNIETKGDGIGIGGKLGVTWKVAEHQRLALTARLPITVDYEGDFTLDNVPAALGGGTIQRTFNSSITFPTTIAAGYGIELTDKIRIEADFEWLQFSQFDQLPLEVPGAAQLGLPSNVRENWKNTFTAGIGGDWKFHPDWVLRAGYQYYESPVPDATFSPAIPDANQNVITVGLGYKYRGHSFEFAYGADFYNQRNIQDNQNPAYNGKYKITVHLFSVAYRYAF
jgi:long-chain fatty acid transport protein